MTKIVPTLEFPGVKYPGRMAIADTLNELQRQAKAYRDFVVSTKGMSLVANDKHGILLSFAVGDETFMLPISKRGYLQLTQWIGLPTSSCLYKRLRYGSDDVRKRQKGEVNDRFWNTLRALVNDHFSLLRAKKLIRMLKNQDGQWYVRAILSDRYKIIPNDQLFLMAAERIKEIGAEVWDARLSEDAFYLYCVAPGVSAQIRTDRPFDTNVRWAGDAGDSVNAALMIRNSETGQGGCEVCPAIMTKVTGAYLVKQNALSMRHIGKRHEMDAMLSFATIQKQNALVFDKVRDFIVAAFDVDRFQDFVDKLQDATQDELEDPAAAAEAVRVVYDLGETRKAAIINWLMTSGDKSRYGLAQAVAREAHDNDRIDADEAAHLERVGSDLIIHQTSLKLAKAFASKAVQKANETAAATLERLEVQATSAIGIDGLDF